MTSHEPWIYTYFTPLSAIYNRVFLPRFPNTRARLDAGGRERARASRAIERRRRRRECATPRGETEARER